MGEKIGVACRNIPLSVLFDESIVYSYHMQMVIYMGRIYVIIEKM